MLCSNLYRRPRIRRSRTRRPPSCPGSGGALAPRGGAWPKTPGPIILYLACLTQRSYAMPGLKQTYGGKTHRELWSWILWPQRTAEVIPGEQLTDAMVLHRARILRAQSPHDLANPPDPSALVWRPQGRESVAAAASGQRGARILHCSPRAIALRFRAREMEDEEVSASTRFYTWGPSPTSANPSGDSGESVKARCSWKSAEVVEAARIPGRRRPSMRAHWQRH
jgi:hypothetical protein